jgi:hypothetical protein
MTDPLLERKVTPFMSQQAITSSEQLTRPVSLLQVSNSELELIFMERFGPKLAD